MTHSIEIRGMTYPSARAAANVIGVQIAAISKAKIKGTLDIVGLCKSGKVSKRYDSQRDAEYILEKIMHRMNWSVEVRDELQAHLETVTRAKL